MSRPEFLSAPRHAGRLIAGVLALPPPRSACRPPRPSPRSRSACSLERGAALLRVAVNRGYFKDADLEIEGCP